MKNPSPEQRKRWNDAYYAKNKEKVRQVNITNRETIKEWFKEYKSSLSCARRGFSHPAALQFHHLSSENKEFEVSRMAGTGFGIKSILEEIEKCEVLCANCHAIEHYNQKCLCNSEAE